MSTASFLGSALLVAPLTAWSGQENGAPAEELRGVELTYLANAGYYLRAKGQSVLIDACVREPVAIHAALPGHVHGLLTNVKPPFDEPMLVLVSHNHADHVQPRVLLKLLTKNTEAHLATTAQVVQTLRELTEDFTPLQERITIVQAVPGTPTTLERDGLRVDFLRLEHSGKGHGKLEHFAHLIEMGGVRILHVGDAEPTPLNFAAYHLEQKPIDVAIVPYWYLGSEGGAEVLREHVRARQIVVSHVPPTRWDELDEFLKKEFPEVILFKESLEKRTVVPAETPPAAQTDGGATEGG